MKNKWINLSISLWFCLFVPTVKTNNVFIPNRKIDYSNFPPFTSNLIKDEREKIEKKENKAIEEIVERVVSSNDKELEQEAENLVKDKKKLDNFLSAFPKDILKHDSKVDNRGNGEVGQEIRDLLQNVYQSKDLTEKKITLKLKNSNIIDAIELINRSSGLSFVVDSWVSGKINNINLDNVSVASALNIILSSNDPPLALIQDMGILRVLREQDAVKILKNKISDLASKDFSSAFVTMYNAKFTESFKLRVEKMWHGIMNSDTGKSGYYLVFDDSSRKIFFKGRKKDVQDFRKFLKEIDFKVPQVRIEARVIVASKDFEESFGLQVSGIYNRASSITHGWDYVGGGDVKSPNGGGDFKPGMIDNWALNLLPASASQFLNIPFIFGGKDLDTKRLNLVLNASENRNEIKTILKPTLLVNSEEMAQILVGEQVPIETQVQERIEGSVRQMDTINYKDLGMKLHVKPVVSPDCKTVFMDIFVENSFVKSGGTSSSFDAKKSIIATTKSKSRVLLKSGQTTLIGGLISDDKRISKQGVPILQEIPVLGFLFKGSKRGKRDEQLMIFISPTVV